MCADWEKVGQGNYEVYRKNEHNSNSGCGSSIVIVLVIVGVIFLLIKSCSCGSGFRAKILTDRKNYILNNIVADHSMWIGKYQSSPSFFSKEKIPVKWDGRKFSLEFKSISKIIKLSGTSTNAEYKIITNWGEVFNYARIVYGSSDHVWIVGEDRFGELALRIDYIQRLEFIND